jgi:hypothetical protein
LKLAWSKLAINELAGLLADPRVAVRNRAIELLGERATTAPQDVLAAVLAQHASKAASHALHRIAAWPPKRSAALATNRP